MARTITLKDWPRILKLALRKYRGGNSDFLDPSGTRDLERAGLPVTGGNANLYNLGRGIAYCCLIGSLFLFSVNDPRNLAHGPLYVYPLALAAPVLVPGLLCLAFRRPCPTLARSLRRHPQRERDGRERRRPDAPGAPAQVAARLKVSP